VAYHGPPEGEKEAILSGGSAPKDTSFQWVERKIHWSRRNAAKGSPDRLSQGSFAMTIYLTSMPREMVMRLRNFIAIHQEAS
jgi:hypothetical protein